MIRIDMNCSVCMEDGSDMDNETFVDEFIKWIESKGMLCDGGFTSVDEDEEEEQ